MEYHGCGSHLCKIKKPDGQGTNGPCACFNMCPQEAKVWLSDITNQRRLLLEALERLEFEVSRAMSRETDEMSNLRDVDVDAARAAIAAARGEG